MSSELVYIYKEQMKVWNAGYRKALLSELAAILETSIPTMGELREAKDKALESASKESAIMGSCYNDWHKRRSVSGTLNVSPKTDNEEWGRTAMSKLGHLCRIAYKDLGTSLGEMQRHTSRLNGKVGNKQQKASKPHKKNTSKKASLPTEENDEVCIFTIESPSRGRFVGMSDSADSRALIELVIEQIEPWRSSSWDL